MLDRPAPRVAVSDAAALPAPRWPLLFAGLAGLCGAAGVAIGAAGAHVGGGDLARTSSEFLLVHAAALLGGSGLALAVGRRSALLALSLSLMAAGAVLFGGELAFAALLDWRPVPLAAPTGGMCLIAGWLLLAAAAVRLSLRRA